MTNILEKAIAYTKALASEESTGHDFHHAMRVYNTALNLSANKEVNQEVIALASLLHDLDDYKVSGYGSHRVIDFLKEHADKETREKVLSIIDNMSYSSHKQGKKVESLEGKIVQDADRLDALGAIGIARCFAYSGKINRLIYNYSIDDNSAIAHFYQKLFNLADLMNTEEAKKIAEERIAFMKEYLKEFFKEWL